MKKNKMMRIASLLLIAVLLTTSVISGTFAKYVTSDNHTEAARVAKFGVDVVASGSLFSNTYITHDATAGDSDTDKISVKSTDDAKVVAPGTSNNNGLTFKVTGTPEVDVRVNLTVTGADIFLKGTNLPDKTIGKAGTFSLANIYYPVKYTLTQTKKGSQPNTLVDGKTIADVKTALENLSAYYNTNTDLEEEVGTLKLTWEWAFGGEQTLNGTTFDATTVDKADTLLGDLAAGTATGVASADYSLDTSVAITVSVTQVD